MDPKMSSSRSGVHNDIVHATGFLICQKQRKENEHGEDPSFRRETDLYSAVGGFNMNQI